MLGKSLGVVRNRVNAFFPGTYACPDAAEGELPAIQSLQTPVGARRLFEATRFTGAAGR